jgi:hypothetical protein
MAPTSSNIYVEQSAHMTSKIPQQVKTQGFTWENLCGEKTHGLRRPKLQYEDEEYKRRESTNEGRLYIPKSLSSLWIGVSQSPLSSL